MIMEYDELETRIEKTIKDLEDVFDSAFENWDAFSDVQKRKLNRKRNIAMSILSEANPVIQENRSIGGDFCRNVAQPESYEDAVKRRMGYSDVMNLIEENEKRKSIDHIDNLPSSFKTN